MLCFVYICVCVFLCVFVCNTCVCPLEFVGQFNSQVCLWLGSWLIRQTEASCKLKSVNNQRRHNLYSQTLHYQTLTTDIMAPYQYSLDVFGDFNISRVSPQIVYRCSDNFWQCWSLYSPNLTILLSEFNSMVLDSGGLVWSAAGSTCKVKISQPSTTSTQAGKSNRIKII